MNNPRKMTKAHKKAEDAIANNPTADEVKAAEDACNSAGDLCHELRHLSAFHPDREAAHRALGAAITKLREVQRRREAFSYYSRKATASKAA